MAKMKLQGFKLSDGFGHRIPDGFTLGSASRLNRAGRELDAETEAAFDFFQLMANRPDLVELAFDHGPIDGFVPRDRQFFTDTELFGRRNTKHDFAGIFFVLGPCGRAGNCRLRFDRRQLWRHVGRLGGSRFARRFTGRLHESGSWRTASGKGAYATASRSSTRPGSSGDHQVECTHDRDTEKDPQGVPAHADVSWAE
jgi:hypothetical protein